MSAAEILGECVRLRKHYLEEFAKKYDSNYIQGFSSVGGSGRDYVLQDNIFSVPSPSTTKYNSYDGDNTLHPFVLLLGNHSSGKSSFINYLLGRKVQATGVAPTDDSFTVIVPSNLIDSENSHKVCDVDRNGPALVGDPDLGFGGLQKFGDVLVNHTMLKIRSDTRIKDFCLVDSPGMIDSPIDHSRSAAISTSAKGRQLADNSNYDRGYDFAGVCRWYAERADVILLFFDPDKPGTTGETLNILTSSLVGLDHKLHIILNKADQFVKIHDFARAYGSLCWNLSKVIPRKDLPRIHTMCLPVSFLLSSATLTSSDGLFCSGEADTNEGRLPYSTSTITATSAISAGYRDLEESRMEVLKIVLAAPRCRVDNELSRLALSARFLLLHCSARDVLLRRYLATRWRSLGKVVLCGLLSAGLTTGLALLIYRLENGSEKKNADDSSAAPGPGGKAIGAAKKVSSSAKSAPASLALTLSPSAGDSSSSVSSMSVSLFARLNQVAAAALTQLSPIQSAVLLGTAVGCCCSVVASVIRTVSLSRQRSYLASLECVTNTVREIQVTGGELLTEDLEGPPGQATILGRRVVANLQHSLSEKQLVQSQLVMVDPHDLATLRRILAEDIPALRRKAGVPQPYQPPHLPYMESYNTPSTPSSNIESSPPSAARRESVEVGRDDLERGVELFSPGNVLEQPQSRLLVLENEEDMEQVAQGDSS